MTSNIAIIIPAYNESDNIKNLIKKIRQNIKPQIIVVDDSNNNLTKNILKKIKTNIIYIKRNKKLGRGSAVLEGLKNSLKKKEVEIFIEMDADLSHPPNELRRNIRFFNEKNLDLLIGSRYLKESQIINWPASRRIFSKLANYLARFLLKIPCTDYTNGYRIYSRSAAKKIVQKCGKIGDGFIILSEILLVLYKNNFRIGEIKTKFVNRSRGESSANLKLIIASLVGLIKIFLKRNSTYY
jgi:glycosyltransferase involved in cell wall biosynthesis